MEMTKFLISRITNSNVTEELEIMAGDRAHAIAQAREMPNHSQWKVVDSEIDVEYEVEEV